MTDWEFAALVGGFGLGWLSGMAVTCLVLSRTMFPHPLREGES